MGQNQALGKDEMLAMIKYGADAIFASKDATVTDQDIDELLSIGEKRTIEMSEKLKETTNSLLNNANFKMDDPDFSLYMFQGEDYAGQIKTV